MTPTELQILRNLNPDVFSKLLVNMHLGKVCKVSGNIFDIGISRNIGLLKTSRSEDQIFRVLT